MPFPALGSYGIDENPLLFSPFVENNSDYHGGSFPSNSFLLLDGERFLLLDGEQFLLLGT